jgi:hypothetical protein
VVNIIFFLISKHREYNNLYGKGKNHLAQMKVDCLDKVRKFIMLFDSFVVVSFLTLKSDRRV